MALSRILATFILIAAGTAAGLATSRHDIASGPSLATALTALDDAIADSPARQAVKKARLDSLERRFADVRNSADASRLLEEIYSEAFNFDPDRALDCADRGIASARAVADRPAEALWLLRRGAVMAKSEQIREAKEYVGNVDIALLDSVGRSEYYATMAHIYAHFGRFSSHEYTSRYFALSRQYEDSCLAYLQPGSIQALSMQGLQASTDADRRRSVARLRPLAAVNNFDDRYGSTLGYTLGHLYDDLAMPDSARTYYALSALADTRACNKDVVSLLNLSSLCLERGDTRRALNYCTFALAQAQAYGNIHHLNELLSLENDIAMRYQQEEASHERILWVLVALLALAAAGLGAGWLITSRRSRTMAPSMDALRGERAELVGHNADLRGLNADLEAANAAQQRSIIRLLILSSEFLDRLDKQRKEVGRKLKAGQAADLQRLACSDRQQADLREYYREFDSIVLDIYPDFIEQFNALLTPDSRTQPREGEQLNTMLRIHALVRVGIADSVTIARLLHCSTQTVYNNRQTVRNNSVCSREELNERLCS